MTKSNKIKKLTVGATLALVLGGGVTAVLVPTFATAAVASHGADDPAGHVRHGADDPVGHLRHGADDAVRAVSQGADDSGGHGRNGADDGPGHR